MKDYIAERVLNIANYMIESGCTVRSAASRFGVSKSTVHKDISERLKYINPALADMARTILDTNKSERHLRGGIATKLKYQQKKNLYHKITDKL